MAIFDFLRRGGNAGGETASTPTPIATEPQVDDVLLKALFTDEELTREDAMAIPAVSAAVDFIASSIACMPVKLYKRVKSTRTVKNMDDDARVQLLNGDTGDTLDAYQMKYATVRDYLMGEGGYIYIRKNRNDVTGLFHVSNDYVAPEIIDPDPIHKKYKLMVYTNEYELFEFIKLLRNSDTGAYGVGLTKEIAKALHTAYSTLDFQLYCVKNGGNKKGFLKSKSKLDQNAINTLKKAWKQLYTNNSENVVVLNNGLEFQEASNSSVEMQLDQNKQTLDKEIAKVFHIYDEDYYRTFKEAIYPVVKAFETALNRDLLLEKEKRDYYFEFDVKEILRVNVEERFKAYKLAKETGFMTINEIRRAENMERIEGMDVINVGLASVLYDTNTGKYYTPNVDKVTDPNAAEGNEPDEATKKEDEHLVQEDINHEEYTQEEEEGNVE